MNNELSTLFPVNFDNDRITLSARDLHSFLEVTERFSSWFDRMTSYGFQEEVDYLGCKVFNALAKQELQDYQITLDMAKHIAMVQRSEKGKQVREYFMEVERQWNSPEKVMARGLMVANKTIECQKETIKRLSYKADYFDDMVKHNHNTTFRVTAKELEVGEKYMVQWLIDNGYLYRNGDGALLPYAGKNKGYFVVKDVKSKSSAWTGVQTLITIKGKMHIKKQLEREEQANLPTDFRLNSLPL